MQYLYIDRHDGKLRLRVFSEYPMEEEQQVIDQGLGKIVRSVDGLFEQLMPDGNWNPWSGVESCFEAAEGGGI